MNIRFYENFAKRKNSTKTPSGSVSFHDTECKLKEDTGLENPSIILSGRFGTDTRSGNPVTLSNAMSGNAKALTVDMLPIQDLHGYNKPWSGGNGKNKFNKNGKDTTNGYVEGKYLWSSGDAQTPQSGEWYISEYIPFAENTDYALSGLETADSYSPSMVFYNANKEYISGRAYQNIATRTGTTPANTAYIRLSVGNLSTTENNIQLEVGSSATSYEPYSNSCPISGRSSLDVTVNGNTETINLGDTVYGGTCDVVGGGTSDLWVNIPSYSGETLGTEWYSSLDEPNTPPTIGAQVVYKSNQAISTLATSISLNKGNNTLATSGDNMTVTYDTLSPSGELPFNYTNAYISKFNKYYFMSMPTILTDGQIRYDLEEDYLASHKTEIGSTVAHIAYSSTGWDKDLTDGRIAVKGTKTIYHDSQALGFDGGCYIIGVVNNDSNGKLGALSYYRMDAANLAKLIKYMMQDSFWDKIKQYFNGKTLDFIQSCIWVPVSGSGFVGTMQTTFYVGDTAIADYSTVPETPVYITHYPVTTPVAELGSVVSLSLGSKFQDFRDNQPYSSASLYLPGVGLTDLNINDFYESASVNVQTIFDITTGDCTYKIYDDTNQLLKTVSFNASASVSLSQVNINSAGAIAGIGGAVGGVVGLGLSAVTMNPVGMATAGVGILAGASAAVMSANQRSTSIKGTNSGRSGFYTRTASTVVVRQDTEDPDNANYIARCGRPVGQTHAISNHSGYVQCEGASVSIAGDNSERDIINNYLNTGFYYE